MSSEGYKYWQTHQGMPALLLLFDNIIQAHVLIWAWPPHVMMSLTLMCMIRAWGPSQASSATLQGSTAQVTRWPSLYTEQNAMWDSVTWTVIILKSTWIKQWLNKRKYNPSFKPVHCSQCLPDFQYLFISLMNP